MRNRSHASTGAHDDPVATTRNFSPLEGDLRDLTKRIEALRHHTAAPDVARMRTQQNLDEIVAPLMNAIPLRAIETLDSDVQTLAGRLDTSRASGIDPKILAPIQHGFDEVRAVLDHFNARENLTTLRAAIQDLTDRLNRPRDRHYVSPQPEIEAVIDAVRNIGGLAASQEMVKALADEVRGLSAKLQRILTRDRTTPAVPAAVGPSVDAPPFSIEENLKDINRRLDMLQKGAQPSGAQAVEADPVNPDRSAQDALAAVHATLSHLVVQLGSNLNGVRDANAPSSLRHPGLSGGYLHNPRGLLDFANEHDPEFSQPRSHDAAPYASSGADIEPERARRSIVIPIKPLIVSTLVIVLAVVAARVSMQLTDLPLPAITKADAFQAADLSERKPKAAPAEPEVPDLVRSHPPETFTLPPAPQSEQAASAIGEIENTGVIGRPVPVAAGSREAREPSMPLPDSLPAALRAEANKGRPAAEYEVGVRLVEGKTVSVNTEEAMRWLKRAAKSGIIPAHLWIGSLYEKGLGVEKDLMLARTHYTAAAEKGNAKAMHNLAVLYAEGIDGRRDYKTAARWFQRAAERGIADSQYNLAILLMRGIGIDQNHQESYKWFALAALQGDREAARQRDDIGSKLEPGILAAAKSSVQKFSPQSQPNEAVVVATPPGGWDRPSGETAGGRGKTQSGIFARGAS